MCSFKLQVFLSLVRDSQMDGVIWESWCDGVWHSVTQEYRILLIWDLARFEWPGHSLCKCAQRTMVSDRASLEQETAPLALVLGPQQTCTKVSWKPPLSSAHPRSHPPFYWKKKVVGVWRPAKAVQKGREDRICPTPHTPLCESPCLSSVIVLCQSLNLQVRDYRE